MKSKVVRVLAIIMILPFTLFLYSAYADDLVPYPDIQGVPGEVLWDETGTFLVYELLRSWGIEIEYGDIRGFNMSVSEWITNQVLEYLDTIPSVASVALWVIDWLWGTDFWGNIQVNNTMLEDVQDFADWLVSKYSLTDNSEIIINPVYEVDGYQLLRFGEFYNASYSNDGTAYGTYVALDLETQFQGAIGYIVMSQEYRYHNEFSALVFFEQTGNAISISSKGLRLDGTVGNVSTSSGNVTSAQLNNNGYYVTNRDIWHRDNEHGFFVPDVDYPTFQTSEQYEEFRNTADIVQSGDVLIVTNTIVPPDQNPDYTPGDGVTIIDGDPDYSELTLSGTVTVGNYPSAISPISMNKPEFGDAFAPISAVINMGRDGIEAIRAMILEMPVELITAFYALLGAIVILGMIKIMREH